VLRQQKSSVNQVLATIAINNISYMVFGGELIRDFRIKLGRFIG